MGKGLHALLSDVGEGRGEEGTLVPVPIGGYSPQMSGARVYYNLHFADKEL